MDELLFSIKEAADTIAAPNWAVAISAFATVGTVIVAIMIAIKQIKLAKEQNEISRRQNEIVQKQMEISEQQNKISLFKERYSVYCELQKIISFGRSVKNMKLHDDATDEELSKFPLAILKMGLFMFGMKPSMESTSRDELYLPLYMQIESSKYLIKQAIFLFNDIEEKDIDVLVNSLSGYIFGLTFLGGDSSNSFSRICEEFCDKYMMKIESMLNLR